MTKEMNLYNDGLEEYPLSVVVKENTAIALWLILGTLIISQVSCIIGSLYLICALSMILVVMRKLLCTHCYYYGKVCHVGWGKLAALLFPKGEITQFSTCKGQKAAPIFFAALALIPVIFSLISLIIKFKFYKLPLIAVLIGTIIYSSVFARKKSCMQCKMKTICPGSASFAILVLPFCFFV